MSVPSRVERRINAHSVSARPAHSSREHANVYGKLFPHPTLAIAARGVVFVTGALLGLLAVVSVLNEDRLLFMSLGGRQLFFYGTVLGAVFAGARSLVPIQQDYVIDPEVTMKRVASHTHYFPRAGAPVPWAGRCHTHAVKEDFNGKNPWCPGASALLVSLLVSSVSKNLAITRPDSSSMSFTLLLFFPFFMRRFCHLTSQ